MARRRQTASSISSSTALPGKFLNRPPRLIDGYMGVSRSAGVGIGNGDVARRLPRHLVWRLALRPLRIPQVHVLISVAMGPPIDGYREDVVLHIEASGSQQPVKNRTYLSLEVREAQGQQFFS